ncbi:MAG: methionine aminotransferase [Crocinitomicaceae bacterium]|nr:methionine aminotransferase [Crocinitomicaceae bacterium]
MSKLPHVGTTIFSVMSKLAAESNAINLSQGFPNFPVDPKLIELYQRKVGEEVHQYAPMPGNPRLITEIAELIQSSYNRRLNPGEEILVTAGATQGIFTAITALIEKGDEVIILDPSYDCYEPTITLSGGIPIRIQLDENFLPNWDAIESAVSDKTRMIITNNPHNPSGRIWDKSDMDTLEQLILKNPNLLVLSDEVYEFITFEQKHISAHAYESIHDKLITVSSFGKTFHITGWKMGYLVAPNSLMVEIKKVHQFNVFSVNSVAQAVLADYLPTVDVQTLGKFYQDKRDLFRSLMAESRFELLPCDGTYFQTARYSEISQASDVEFCKTLTTKYGVAAIPTSVFNGDGSDQHVIRFCFAKDADTLQQAAKKLCAI